MAHRQNQQKTLWILNIARRLVDTIIKNVEDSKKLCIELTSGEIRKLILSLGGDDTQYPRIALFMKVYLNIKNYVVITRTSKRNKTRYIICKPETKQHDGTLYQIAKRIIEVLLSAWEKNCIDAECKCVKYSSRYITQLYRLLTGSKSVSPTLWILMKAMLKDMGYNIETFRRSVVTTYIICKSD